MLDGNREEPWRVESSTLFSNDFFSSVAVCSKIIHQWFWRWGEVLSGTDLGKADDYDVEGSLEGEMMMMIMTMKMMMAKMQRGGEGWKGRCTSEDGPQTLHPSPQSTPQSTIPSAQSPVHNLHPSAQSLPLSAMHCAQSILKCTAYRLMCTAHCAVHQSTLCTLCCAHPILHCAVKNIVPFLALRCEAM